MTSSQRTVVAGGLVLILIGTLLLLGQLIPGLWSWVNELSWPLIIVGAGALLLIVGVFTDTPGMAVPAFIVSGVGCLLFWQNRTGNWASWAYVWTLIPGFVGIGTIVAGLWQRKGSEVRGGLWLVLISAILFAVFGSFLGGLFGADLGLLGRWWPVLLILVGVLSLIDRLSRPGHAA